MPAVACPWGFAYAGAVACPWALQTEVSGMPCGQPVWVPRHAHGHHKPRLVWPALVCDLACLGGVPRHAMAGLGGRVPWHARGHYETEVSGMPWPAFGGAVACLWGCDPGGCRGMPWWVPWGCQGMPWLALLGAMACPAGCHGMP